MSNELTEIEQQISSLLAKKESILNSKRQDVLREVKTLVAQYSLTASELGLRDRGRAGNEPSKAPAKYANPSDASQRWAGGKGARPLWVKHHLENGGNLDDLLINKG